MRQALRGRKFYDRENQRLVFVNEAADEEFWDDLWAGQAGSTEYKRTIPRTSFVLDETRRHLPIGARVLEGGCGLAVGSWHLHLAGYDAVALDYAPRTIDFLKSRIPEVSPTLGDVRALPFPSANFDGYWSIGVIEHFFDGWDAIRSEMARVIKPGGFLFLTFPWFSPLRRTMAGRGWYETWGSDADRTHFYQFALDAQRVVEPLLAGGFVARRRSGLLGLSGLGDTFPSVEPFVDRARKSSRPIRALVGAIGETLAPWTGHSVLLVLQRTD